MSACLSVNRRAGPRNPPRVASAGEALVDLIPEVDDDETLLRVTAGGSPYNVAVGPVPGVGPDGIDIQFQGGVLTLRAKSDEPDIPEGSTWLVHEVTPGEYIRQVTLPRTIDADKARTTFEHGVLTLTLPKTADAKPKQIKVETSKQIGAGAAG